MADLRIGVVGIPGRWSSEVLADRVAAATGSRILLDMAAAKLDLAGQRLLIGDLDLCELDALVIKKISADYSAHTLDRLEMLRFAELRGVRVCSPAAQLLGLIDRLSCTVTLSAAGVPMPETVVTEDTDVAIEAVRAFGAAVLKPLYSTKARGMCVLEAGLPDAELRARLEEYRAGNPVLYLQRRLELPGRDLGIVFVGGEYLCSYARVAGDASWNTTIHAGGRYEACEPDVDLLRIARQAQACFNLDFTTVDVAETAAGPVVFEVSAFGGFRGAREGAGVDAAEAYVRHVLNALRG